MRVVLDTNVLVSMFVFADSRVAVFRERLEAGTWVALTNERCLGEFRRVLAYPQFGLDGPRQEEALADYSRLAVPVPPAAGPVAHLPQCRDGDDQKFLELARDGRAQWLVTADKALLRLGRRQRLRGLFSIVTPEQAVAP